MRREEVREEVGTAENQGIVKVRISLMEGLV
jgi:DNA-binding transcriptional regulator LsrR (DeoR family)